MAMRRLECGSVANGRLAKGCELCTEGAKMVLFVSGRCDTGCFYCPVSDEKKGKDTVYANEMPISDIEEIVTEAASMDALGTGITGGGPLLCVDRTVDMIRLLKDRFGKDHHIHLYTSTIDPDIALRLFSEGLDEIRFHPSPDIWDSLGSTRIAEVTAIDGLTVGLEVPALPGFDKELRKMVSDSASLGVDFINLNELEFSEGNWDMMSFNGYELKDDISAAIAGSEELALSVMKASSVPIHFCSSAFKDSVQLRKRLIRRAEHISLPYDLVTEDGTILKGILYADDIDEAVSLLRDTYDVPDELMRVDTDRNRLEVASWVLEELADELPFKCYIVEEYPTADRLEVERIPL